jgi:hypothetical protein
MATIDISARIIGDKELAAALAKLSSHDVPKAIKAGVRFAANRAKPRIAQEIGKRYNLKASRIKQDIYSPQFRQGGELAVIKTSRKPITAQQFGLREGKRDITYAIFRGERTRIRGGFLQTSKSGKFEGRRAFQAERSRPYQGDVKTIGFWDAVNGVRNRRKPRHGMRMVLGPSIHAIYTGGKWRATIQHHTEKALAEHLQQGILRALGAKARGYGPNAG